MRRLPAVAVICVFFFPALAAAQSPEKTLSRSPDHNERRPAALSVLYGTYAAVQALDVVSTRKALAAGATEQNPMMHGGVGGAIAIKAAAGLSTIYFTERAWKKNRVGAIVLMIGLNTATAAIAAHNMRVNSRR